MSNWPFPKQPPNPEQVERLRRLARQEMEQGISREIAARVEAAESRAASLERECERLTAENEHKSHTIASMAAVIQSKDALIVKLRGEQA